MTQPHSLIIDADPGQDDAVAILLALASPEINLLGITTVAGNVPLALTQENARKICDLAGRTDMQVFAGLDRPLVRPLVTAEHVHGRTGLDGPVLPDPETAPGTACGGLHHRYTAPRTGRQRDTGPDRTSQQYCHGDATRP